MLAMINRADFAPTLVGRKVTSSSVEVAAGSVVMAGVSAKKSLPCTVALEMVSVTTPRLNTVTFLVSEVPAATVPKSSDPGSTSISGRARVVPPPPQSQPGMTARPMRTRTIARGRND